MIKSRFALYSRKELTFLLILVALLLVVFPLALDVFRHRLLAGIGAMAASLGGVDLIGLTGGIGSHDMELLEDLQQALAWLGPLQWLQLEADEESMIAGLISDRGGRASGEAAGSVADDRR